MPDLEAPIKAMIDATNAEDTAGFLDAFAEDAVLVDWGREFAGKREIARWNSNENIGVHSRLKVTAVRPSGNAVEVGIEVSGGGYNGGGSMIFLMRDGLIYHLLITG